MRFRDAELSAAREGLRATATTLVAFRRGRAHGYEQHGYVSRSALGPEALVLATLRTWGDPNPRDFVWYERAAVLASTGGAQAAAVDAAELALRRDPQGRDDRAAEERAAVRAHAEAIVEAARRSPALLLFTAQCGWADSNGALAHGLALVAPATREVYFSYLVETWAE